MNEGLLLRRKLTKDVRPTTGDQVAELAGVSRAAVSRAFTSGASISPEMRERVLQAARQLGYQPNQIARSLSTNRSHLIGVALSHLDNQFYPEMLEQLSTRLAEIGYRVALFITKGHGEEDPVLGELLRQRVDALVMASGSPESSKLAEQCQGHGIPAVMLNHRGRSQTLASVSSANAAAGETIAAFMVEAGHRRLAFIAGPKHSSASADRRKGFQAYLRRRGLDCAQELNGDYSFDAAARVVRELFKADDAPDGIFCANDHMAIAVLETVRSEFHRTPGKDLSVIGFDDVKIAAWPSFGLTTFSQPVEAMVDRTLAILEAALEGRTPETIHAVIKGQLVVRSSALRPASGRYLKDGERTVWRPDKVSKTARLKR